MMSNGSDSSNYSVPQESKAILQNGILNNPLISKDLPENAQELGSKVRYTGSDAPCVPINWRFAESVSALKGLEAVMVMALLKRKYNVDVQEVNIDTDHATLFFMSTLLWTIDPEGDNIGSGEVSGGDKVKAAKFLEYFPSYDFHRGWSTLHRASTTNIYKTKDGRFFHLHGGLFLSA
jgi:hypothetical protein